MTDVKNNFDFNFQRATSLDVQDDGSDPTNNLYKFASNAGERNSDQYLFYARTKLADPDPLPISNLCLGKYAHRNYQIDRAGNIFYAEWLLRREGSGVTSYLKDYEATGTSIDPADIGKVFKGEEFTEAMTAFYREYKAQTKALAAAIKNSPHAKTLDAQAYGELAGAVAQNDLAKVFGTLFDDALIDDVMDTVRQIEKLRQYLDMGLELSRGNPRAYKMKNTFAIKADIAAAEDSFKGLKKMRSGKDQEIKVKDRLGKPNVLNALCTQIFSDNIFTGLTEEPANVGPSAAEVAEATSDEGLEGETPAAVDETAATESTATEDVVPEPELPGNANITDTNSTSLYTVSAEVEAAIAASSAEATHHEDSLDENLREGGNGDASPTRAGVSTTDSLPEDVRETLARVDESVANMTGAPAVESTDVPAVAATTSAPAVSESTSVTADAKTITATDIKFKIAQTQSADVELKKNEKLMGMIALLKSPALNVDDVLDITITGIASAHGEYVIDGDKKVLVTAKNIGKYVDANDELKPGYTWAAGTVPTNSQLPNSTKTVDNPKFAKDRAEFLKNFLVKQGVRQEIIDKIQTKPKGGSLEPKADLSIEIKNQREPVESVAATDETDEEVSTGKLNFKNTADTFQITQSAPEFEFEGDASQIQSVTNGFKKNPLAFEIKDGKLVVTGLVGYSKAVIKLFIKQLRDNDALLAKDEAELRRKAWKKAKMDYPVIVTLSDGTKIKLNANGSETPKKARGSKFAVNKAQMDKEIAENSGLLQALNSMDSAVIGGDGLGGDVTNAVGGLIGTVGTQYGRGGLGDRGDGWGGGGNAEGIGGLGTRGSGLGSSGYGRGAGFYGTRGEETYVRGSDPIILGALGEDVIEDVVLQHMDEIRACYQGELAKNPKLFGKLVVKFVIATDGRVSSATTKSSTLNNKTVEEGINELFKTFKFPEPKGDGVVIVSYPFVFNPRET